MAGGGGAWKVAYADFVTAMMAFFMVMWLTSQKPEIKEAVADYFSDPWAKYKSNYDKVRRPTLFDPKVGEKRPKKEFRGSNPTNTPHDEPEQPNSVRPKINTLRAPERTTEGAIVQFAPGVDELSKDAEDRLSKLVPRLKGLQQKIELRSHISTQAASTDSDSQEAWDLCYRRAFKVKRFLEASGLSSDRMVLNIAGPYEPLTLQGTDERQDRNSRVEVFLLAETVESFKGTKAERAKQENIDDSQLEDWLQKNDPAAAAEAAKKKSHGGH